MTARFLMVNTPYVIKQTYIRYLVKVIEGNIHCIKFVEAHDSFYIEILGEFSFDLFSLPPSKLIQLQLMNIALESWICILYIFSWLLFFSMQAVWQDNIDPDNMSYEVGWFSFLPISLLHLCAFHPYHRMVWNLNDM